MIRAAKVALDVGAVRQRRFLDDLGLLRRADIELPEVGLPLYPARWRDINTMTIGFGHGIAVSPLQLASGVAAVVNGGLLMPATLLKRQKGEAVTARRVMSPRTSATMRQLLRLVVERGTGKRASAPGYLVGGKTGTAEKAAAGGYRQEELISSFVGAFPMTAPRYVVFAMLDEPKGTKATHGFAGGGWTAAPVVSRVVSRVAPILGLEPVDEAAPEVRRALGLPGEAGTAKLASF
jgi:cell division protein FtsI (penicillin-binding protein 3)